MVQFHKVHHAFQNRGPERIGVAFPCCHDEPHRFTVERFAHLLVEPESRTNATDAVIGQLLAVIIEAQSHPVGGCEKRLGNGIAAYDLGAELDPSYEILLAIARVLPVSLDALITPGMGKTEIELKEFNRIYLSCPEAVRETLMDSTRTLAKHLTEFYSKIENP